VTDRKRLLRAVVESVRVTADGATERVQVTVTWAGVHQAHAALTRPAARIDQLSYYPALTERRPPETRPRPNSRHILTGLRKVISS